MEDFEQVKGIGHAKAENIYQALHSSVDIASKAEDALRTVKSDETVRKMKRNRICNEQSLLRC